MHRRLAQIVCRPAVAVLFSASATGAAAAPVHLEIVPGSESHTTYSLSTGGTDRDTATTAGHVTMDVEIDPATHTLTSARFTGGAISYSDTSYTLETTVFGFIPATVRVDNRDILIEPSSVPPDPTISPAGILDNSHHTFKIFSGTTTLQATTVFPVDPLVRDFSTDPSTPQFRGTNTVTATPLSLQGYRSAYRVTFLHIAGGTVETPIPEIDSTLTTTETGGYSATGDLLLPGPEFTAWAATHDVPLASVDAPDPATGTPLVVLYALGLSPGTSQLPLTLSPAGLTIELPDAGLAAPLEIESSPDLVGWSTVPGGSLAPATSGPVTLPLPESGDTYFRIAVPLSPVAPR